MACGTDMRRDDVPCGRRCRILLVALRVFRRTTPLFLHIGEKQLVLPVIICVERRPLYTPLPHPVL